jgi:hypothetical protein
MKKVWGMITDRRDTSANSTTTPPTMSSEQTEIVKPHESPLPSDTISLENTTEQGQPQTHHSTHFESESNIGQTRVTKISKSQLHLTELNQRINDLTKEIHQLTKVRNDDLIAFNDHLRERELHINSLQIELVGEREYRQKTEEDNVRLRTTIDDMRDRGAINSDAYYSEQLKKLNQAMQSWAARAVKSQKSNSSGNLSDAEEALIIQALERLDQGRSVTEMIRSSKTSIRAITMNPRHLIALVRQLISLYLFGAVFRPFCFGLSRDVSELMHKTIASICVNGSTPLAITLTSREKVH